MAAAQQQHTPEQQYVSLCCCDARAALRLHGMWMLMRDINDEVTAISAPCCCSPRRRKGPKKSTARIKHASPGTELRTALQLF